MQRENHRNRSRIEWRCLNCTKWWVIVFMEILNIDAWVAFVIKREQIKVLWQVNANKYTWTLVHGNHWKYRSSSCKRRDRIIADNNKIPRSLWITDNKILTNNIAIKRKNIHDKEASTKVSSLLILFRIRHNSFCWPCWFSLSSPV